MGVGTQTAEATLFLQFEDDSEMEGVLGSKVNCTLKSQTLTFWSKSSVKDHNSSKHVKI